MSGIKQKENVLTFQKSNITRNVNRCLTLLDCFKQEQNIDNSPLVTQAAREVETSYRKLTEQLDGLDTNTQRYIDICVQTVNETQGPRPI